jgi:hypothetical protein
MGKLYNIGLDIDGVSLDFITKFLEYFNMYMHDHRDYWKWVVRKQWTTFHPSDSELCTKKEEKDCFQQFADEGGFLNLELIPGARRFIAKLDQDGHNLMHITSRHKNVQGDTHVSLFNNGLLLLGGRQLLVEYSDNDYTKADICIAQHIDIMVDDRPDYLLEISKRSHLIKTILFRHYQNLEFPKDANFDLIAETWEEVYKYISNDCVLV